MTTAKTIALDEGIRAKLERVAMRRQQDVEVVLDEAVSEFLRRDAARADFRAAALDAWADYQATGLHATAAEVDDWLARLEAGEDASPPRCHG